MLQAELRRKASHWGSQELKGRSWSLKKAEDSSKERKAWEGCSRPETCRGMGGLKF